MDHDQLPAKQSEPTCTVQLKLCGVIAKEIKKTEKAFFRFTGCHVYFSDFLQHCMTTTHQQVYLMLGDETEKTTQTALPLEISTFRNTVRGFVFIYE